MKVIENDPTRDSLYNHYVPLVEIQDFNALVNNKPFFDQPGKINQKHIKDLLKCQEITIIQQENYYTVCIIKNIVKSLI